MYDFKKQLTAGETSERYLDNFFAQWFEIQPATREQQRMGIDRVFTSKSMGKPFTVEYKTDWTAGKTGDAFVETVSVDTQNKPGWAYSSTADYLLYYIPDDMLVYAIRLPRLRLNLKRWERDYPTRSIRNKGYCTIGLLVPLREFEQIAQQVISM